MEIDVRGEMCPYPAMKAKDALKKLSGGDNLVVVTDHAPALSTVPWEGAKQGFTFDIAVSGPGEWRITLERSAAAIDQKRLLADIGRRAAELSGE